jgi:hypothetical protein
MVSKKINAIRKYGTQSHTKTMRKIWNSKSYKNNEENLEQNNK